MKSLALFLLLILALSPLSAEEKDVIIMVDISASIDPYFNEMLEYLRTDLLKGRLDRGNTLHLLSFSGIPEIELSVPIHDDADRTKIFTKLTFLQSIGLYTDLVSAINFLLTYSDNLPQKLRAKEIFLLTDGIHDPPPGSIYDIDSDDVLTELLTSAKSIKKRGYYRGPYPFSENESRAVKQFIENHSITTSVDYHTCGEKIIYPWSWTRDPPPNKPLFLSIAENISQINGYEIIQGSQWYYIIGSSKDWLYAEHGVFPFVIELCNSSGSNAPSDKELILQICKTHLLVNLYVAERTIILASCS